ncbi:hypothetical protein BZA70DRAFT_283521 [Myxozyma melibiosi]|uniref:UBC core domain-containing protein n=1 Tax=Myxozyma melibiosi TaxID=54550 RepID=A0ABR1F2M9_9ASCO
MSTNGPLFYAEDTVYTNDANNIGIVEKTWHDVYRDYPYDDDQIDGPPEIVQHYRNNGLPPRGWTIVAETLGRRAIPDAALRLVDRTFSCGDITRYVGRSSQSGIVLEVSMTVSLQHTLTNQVVHDVPGDELQLYIYPEQGQLISDGERLGEVVNALYRTAIRQPNGGTVWVNEASDLEVVVPATASQVAPTRGIAPALIAAPTEVPFPHQTVVTSRENIRRGQWIYGAYDPLVPPAGTVLRSEVQSLTLRWLPEGIEDFIDVEDADYSKFKVYLDMMDYGNWTVGDRVVLKNGPDAFAKYGLTRLGRERYGGFDVNTLIISETHTKVKVRWQDLTETVEDSKNLAPYVLADDHDIWPGEFVGRKDPSKKQPAEDVDIELDYTHIGVAQSVETKEQSAKVRWFKDTNNLTPENLSDVEEEVSYYELAPHSLISYGIGDYVYLPHAPFLQPESGRTSILEQGGGMMSAFARAILTQGNNQLTQLARSILRTGSGPQSPTSETEGGAGGGGRRSAELTARDAAQSVCDWYGQIVRLNLDGTVIVRLGFFDPPKDVEYPATAIIGLPEDEEEDEDADIDYDGSYIDSEIDMDEDEIDYLHDGTQDASETRRLMVAGEATTRYPDGEQITDDGSSWEDEDDEDLEFDSAYEGHEDLESPGSSSEPPTKVLVTEATQNGKAVGKIEEVEISGPAADEDEDEDGELSRFLIIDSMPGDDHHFASQEPASLNHRRLARERKILQTSLPEGIYVRTYASRLDLYRVLIIGPAQTPYEMAPFMFDMYIKSSFPKEPPECFFHSWNTNGAGRVNPNLYEDGKICLSLLGTWPGEQSTEVWSPETSTILQLLVSLQALVLNNTPYFNEAGYDAMINTDESAVSAELYSQRTFVLSRGFVLYALENPVEEFASVIEHLYYKKGYFKKNLEWIKEVLDNSTTGNAGNTSLAAATDAKASSERISRVSKGARMVLERHYQSLKQLADAKGI